MIITQRVIGSGLEGNAARIEWGYCGMAERSAHWQKREP